MLIIDKGLKIIFGSIFLILIATVTSSSQSSANTLSLTEEEQSWIAEHSTITASNNTAYPPFDFVSAGEPVGLSIDYLNLLTSKVGLKVEYVNYGSLSENLKMGMEQKIDVIHTLVKNEERQKHFTFSDPFVSDDVVLYGRVGAERINNITDLRDKRIGVIKGHAIFTSYQQHYPDFNYVEFNTNMEVLRALSSNEIDVYPYETTPIEFHISQNKLQGIEIVGDDFIMENSAIDYRIAVHKNNPILMSIINKSMAMVTDEEFEAISDKWMHSNQTTQGFRLTSEELDWLAENRVIKVSAQKDSFPFEFIDEEGRISGISGDFLSEIAKRLNVKFIWAGNETWNDGLLAIQSHDADMVAGITPTKERQSFLEFSDVYLNSKYVIVSRDKGPVYSNMDALDGRTVAQIKGTAIIGYLSENYPNIKVVETETHQEAHKLLSSGGADAIIEDATTALASISSFGFENLSIVGTTPYSEATAMGVSSELPLLSSAIEKALTNIDPETRSAIFTKWFTQRIETKVDFGPLYFVIGLAAIIIILSFIWVTKLRQEVSKRIQAETKANIASQAKSEFLASMSHDLRTPLNAIIGFSETILEETFGPVKNKKHAEYIDYIHTSGEYLLHLVNDILDLSALEADKRELNYESFDGELLILECKNITFKLAEDKNIDIVINSSEKLPNVYADRNALKQILMNLISNAIKFTPPNGNITISSNVSDDNYILQVIDTGCGISEEDIRIITKPFTKTQSSVLVSHEEGAGLGLAIVKSLVDVHGGELNIESIVGEGTTVTISIPLQNAGKLS